MPKSVLERLKYLRETFGSSLPRSAPEKPAAVEAALDKGEAVAEKPTGPPAWQQFNRYEQGDDGTAPPDSSILKGAPAEVDPSETIVLQGYSGPTLMVRRALEFIAIAKRNAFPGAERLKQEVERLANPAETHIRRIYLTASFDRYVDFHVSCLVGWRYEASSARQDAITVWLRAFDTGQVPITYRVIQETRIGGATFLGGELLDDYFNQAGSQTGVWGSQAGGNLGNKPWTRTTGC
ncbi:MAG: hypothetical protein AB7O78_05195 [Thermoleophilia bacterium]